MKKVLWVSRHEMTWPQWRDLERVMGGPTQLINWQETVKDPQQLEPLLQEADAAAVVLPPEMLEKLLAIAGEKPVLRAISGRQPTGRVRILPDGRREPEFSFVHQGWEQILHIDIKTRRL